MKKLYEFKKDTGEFTVISNAPRNPKKPGEYFCRANATFDPVPETGDNEVAVWTGSAWEVKPDYRDTTYYQRGDDGQITSVTIKDIGETMPDGAYTDIKEVPETDAEKAARVRGERNALIAEADILINKAEDTGQDTAALRAYRQALRDVPEQSGFPDAVDWPVVPPRE